MKERSIDFFVIGAQKSATTSVFNYLKHHPRIFIPPVKEVPFFIQGDCSHRSFQKHLRQHFGGASAEALWGTVTPQYMMDVNGAAPMHEFAPDARLIAILRNPIDRAISHYKMNCKRRIESRELCDALRACMDPITLREARNVSLGGGKEKDEVGLYLSASEYGRILERYLRFYSKSQLLTIFLDSLVSNPQSEIDRILMHLGLEADYSPPNLGKRYFVNGGRPVDILARIHLRLRKLITGKDATIEGWDSFTEGVDHSAAKVDLPASLRSDLQSFFREDLKKLQQLLGVRIPWGEFGLGNAEAVGACLN